MFPSNFGSTCQLGNVIAGMETPGKFLDHLVHLRISRVKSILLKVRGHIPLLLALQRWGQQILPLLCCSLWWICVAWRWKWCGNDGIDHGRRAQKLFLLVAKKSAYSGTKHACVYQRQVSIQRHLSWVAGSACQDSQMHRLYRFSVYMIYMAASRMKHLHLYTRHFQEKHYHTWSLPKISMSYVFLGSVNFCLIQGVQAGFSGIILTPDFMGQPFEHQIVYAAWQLEVGGGVVALCQCWDATTFCQCKGCFGFHWISILILVLFFFLSLSLFLTILYIRCSIIDLLSSCVSLFLDWRSWF